MESHQVKPDSLGTWLSDIFVSFLLPFEQGLQRSALTVGRAVNSSEGDSGWGSGMVKAWREPEEIHRLAERLLFADTIEGTGSKRCVDACHLLPPFPPLDKTCTAETAARRDEVEARGRDLSIPRSARAVVWLSEPDPSGYCCCFLQSCAYRAGLFWRLKTPLFPVSFTRGSLPPRTELLN